jgi:hypothetical protein
MPCERHASAIVAKLAREQGRYESHGGRWRLLDERFRVTFCLLTMAAEHAVDEISLFLPLA